MNKNEVNDFLCQFDFSPLEELDPSLNQGYCTRYRKEVPFEIRVEESNNIPPEIGSMENITVKLFVLVRPKEADTNILLMLLNGGTSPRNGIHGYEHFPLQGEELNAIRVKMELTCESDLFFHFTQTVDQRTFENMQNKQKLMIDFSEYLQVLIKMFNSCIREPKSYLAVFTLKLNGKAQLDFIKSSEDAIRENIMYRYTVVKSKNAIMSKRLRDVSLLIKSKNPSLLLQLQKTASRQMELAMGKNSNKIMFNSKWV
ncbi:conserved Plasmodium protein, unknown function [Plasmodium ovale wallikeri]|uniref:Spindle assembly abnormal protein 6 N-terminal domain-containing protein n=1 Tax=Plasmodium ovale wallikeri TaxID=864142 RepID=A0A1A8ZUH0_PLAOA|nr:conserved Plasmodium protein, unknown function [Plasmodium ovale wallikeri]